MLKELAARQIEVIRQTSAKHGVTWPADPIFGKHLEQAIIGSDFITQTLLHKPHLITALHPKAKFLKSASAKFFATTLSERLSAVTHEDQLFKALRDYRREQFLRIAWRDLNNYSDMFETVDDLSQLAAQIISQTLDILLSWHHKTQPVNKQGTTQKLLVIALGKLGGEELNFSSDIDLMFAYPDPEQLQQKDWEQFFTMISQKLVAALSQNTEDGFVFRTDLRLRPFGNTGPIALSLSTLEHYYQNYGRDWERYALIKAKVVAGDKKPEKQLMSMLRPFIYRRYLDYSVFESLRDMKELIAREIKLKNRQQDIKLGPGGIRQIEFIGQAFQLVSGGKDPILQQRKIVEVLKILDSKHQLSSNITQKLIAAYIFLRNTENRLQMQNDQQTQTLPTHELARARLAYSMGFDNWQEFIATLDNHRHTVANFFEIISAVPSHLNRSTFNVQPVTNLAPLWNNALVFNQKKIISQLKDLGYQHPTELIEKLKDFCNNQMQKKFSRRGISRLEKLMPMLLIWAGQAKNPNLAFYQLLDLLSAIGKRSAYLALMLENNGFVEHLIKLCEASPWLVQQLCTYPVLLDELLDSRHLYTVPSTRALKEEMKHRLHWIEASDLEQQMESLRQFKFVNVLRVAIADAMGKLSTKRVSDYLSEIAKVILTAAVDIVWGHLTERYGFPQISPGILAECEFAIIGYGKLGGLELGYASDLDLVFVYHDIDPQMMTTGDRPLTNAEFYIRFGQRIFHILNTVTMSGILYALDTRLRPSGQSGLLVCSWNTFLEYQRQEAWTWEHQALVRARIIVGNQFIKRRFTSLRNEIIGRVRDPHILRKEMLEMRQRMQNEKKFDNSKFNLKNDTGGMEDIEFLIQYLILQYANEWPILLKYTDNLRMLDNLQATSVLSEEQAKTLRKIYLTYRTYTHKMALQGKNDAIADAQEFNHDRNTVVEIWQQFIY